MTAWLQKILSKQRPCPQACLFWRPQVAPSPAPMPAAPMLAFPGGPTMRGPQLSVGSSAALPAPSAPPLPGVFHAAVLTPPLMQRQLHGAGAFAACAQQQRQASVFAPAETRAANDWVIGTCRWGGRRMRHQQPRLQHGLRWPAFPGPAGRLGARLSSGSGGQLPASNGAALRQIGRCAWSMGTTACDPEGLLHATLLEYGSIELRQLAFPGHQVWAVRW